MKTIILSAVVFILSSIPGIAGDTPEYIYTINLTKVVDDKVQVELVPPGTEKDTVTFFLPKIVPGTYQISDYGRFITDFKALNKKGKELEVRRLDVNSWQIIGAANLARISYWVDDTYDADMGEIAIYPMSGTNIEKDENFVLNTSGFFGYLEGLTNIPVRLQVVRPENFYGSTGMIIVKNGINPKKEKEFKKYPANSKVDIFNVENYHRLIDSPVMYNIPDTTSVFVEGTQVLVSVYSPGGKVHADFVARAIESLVIAQKNYLGGKLPVDKYAFIFYFEDLSRITDMQGALEHSYSSFYYLPDVEQESLEQSLKDIAAHEFFHIVTPLGIHSEEIEYFDFNIPRMSKHLWLYEGVPEYFAGHVQLKYDLITLDDYLRMIREKLVYSTSQFDDNLPFTELSEYTLDKYPDQYLNVYQKGALIGLCLDIKLRELSSGKYDLQLLLADLTKRFGKNKPFKDDELFDIIQEMTYPEIGDFLRKYVGGSQSLPYTDIFQQVGIKHYPQQETKVFTLGNFGVGLDGNNLVVTDVSNLNEFGRNLGYKEGDILMKFQGLKIPENPYQISPYIENILGEMIEGEDFTVTVFRKDETGNLNEVELKAKAQKFEAYALHVLEVEANPSDAQLQLRKNWIKPQP